MDPLGPVQGDDWAGPIPGAYVPAAMRLDGDQEQGNRARARDATGIDDDGIASRDHPRFMEQHYKETIVEPEHTLAVQIRTNLGREVFIKQMRWEIFRPDSQFCLEGPRGSGKSTILRAALMNVRQDYAKVYVFTGTKQSREYSGIVPEQYIFDNLDDSPMQIVNGQLKIGGLTVLKMIFESQRQLTNEMRDRQRNDRNLNILCILDDLVSNDASNRGFHNVPELRHIAFNGRHIFLTVWYTSQDIKAIPPDLKNNMDIIGILTAMSERTEETIHQHFIPVVHRNEIQDIFKPLEMWNYSCIFINRRNKRVDPTTELYIGQAPQLKKDFVMGDRDFWRRTREGWSWLRRNGYEHILDMEDWGVAQTTYKWNPNGL